jgi:hypothetical protein
MGRIALLLVAAALGLLPEPAPDGRAPGSRAIRNPAGPIEAAFAHDSYAPGSVATLRPVRPVAGLTVQLFRAGPERALTRRNDVMNGLAVTRPRRVRPAGTLRIRVGAWPSGLCAARLEAPGGRVGFAPFVVRPRQLGEHRVAVVLPTFTWQAYNRRDDDGDGSGDTWYADWDVKTARLARPHLTAGSLSTSAATTCPSCAGSRRQGDASTSSRTPTSARRPARTRSPRRTS